jgi:hypothetical protein
MSLLVLGLTPSLTLAATQVPATQGTNSPAAVTGTTVPTPTVTCDSGDGGVLSFDAVPAGWYLVIGFGGGMIEVVTDGFDDIVLSPGPYQLIWHAADQSTVYPMNFIEVLQCQATGGSYYAISPRRILDTRPTVKGSTTNIGLSGKFVDGVTRRFTVAGARYVGGGTASAIPGNAIAVTGNLTVVGETSGGTVVLGQTNVADYGTSTISFVKGDTRANNVTVALDSDGSLSAVYWPSVAGGTTNLIFDLTGYFLAGTAGATYHTVTPGRILDTRPTGAGVTHIGPFSKLVPHAAMSGSE